MKIVEKIIAGFVGFAEVNLPGELILGKCVQAKNELEQQGLDLVYTGPVSDDTEGKDIARAIKELKSKEFNLLVLCIAGWIPSHAVISVIMEFSQKPMVLWGLTGHYENGRLVTTADQAGTSAIRKVMADMGFRFKYIYNTPDGKSKVDSVISYAKAAKAEELMKHSRIGSMGYRDMNLYGTMFDGIALRGKLGVEIEVFEMLEIIQNIENLNKNEVNDVIEKVKKRWIFRKPAMNTTLEIGAKYFLAIRRKINERNYQGVSLKDVDGIKKLAKFSPSMVFMLLANESGICTIPENDSLGSVTQIMAKYLTGQIGMYMEFYEFMEDRVLMGVPDYIPGEATDGSVIVLPTRFGSFDEGLLNVSKVKTGIVTLCRLVGENGEYSMHMVTGDAVTPREWEEAGWASPTPQLPGLEIILDTSVEDFAQNVMSQHYIVTYGDNTAIFREYCNLAGIKMITT